LHDVDLAGKFAFRQGLWIEDLRTPPGQECSNGSLIPPCRSSLADLSLVGRAADRWYMRLLKVKTARFAQVIENCGQPQVYTLWQKPRADRQLQSKIKNNRVMTIQKSENRTEFGMIGFRKRKSASYLVFSKSLKRFENKRIIGINWEFVKL
jgi:hypothetical protein